MENLFDEFLNNPDLRRIVYVFVGIVAILIIAKTVKMQSVKYVSENKNKYRTKKFISLISYVIIIILISIVYSGRLGNITVIIGVTGAGIAFALQEVIASIAGWIAIMSNNFYRTGDRVQLGGIMGDVIDIGVLRTTVMETGQWINGDLYNGRIVFIANSFVFKEPVYNYSGDFPFLWDEIKFPIRYGSDYELTRNLILQKAKDVVGEFAEKTKSSWEKMVKKYMIEDAITEPMVTLVTNDNWVEFTLRYVVDFKKRRTTKDKLYTEILKAIESTEGRVRFASATNELVGAPEINVRIKND